jgi:hypothetical protein
MSELKISEAGRGFSIAVGRPAPHLAWNMKRENHHVRDD